RKAHATRWAAPWIRANAPQRSSTASAAMQSGKMAAAASLRSLCRLSRVPFFCAPAVIRISLELEDHLVFPDEAELLADGLLQCSAIGTRPQQLERLFQLGVLRLDRVVRRDLPVEIVSERPQLPHAARIDEREQQPEQRHDARDEHQPRLARMRVKATARWGGRSKHA